MLVLGAAQSGHHPPLLQEEQGRDAADDKPFRQQGVFLGVNLDDHRLSGKFSGNFPHRRCEVSAVRSPGCPELGEDRARISGNKGIEAPVAQFDRLEVKWGERCLAVAAFARLACSCSGYAVGSAAGGA